MKKCLSWIYFFSIKSANHLSSLVKLAFSAPVHKTLAVTTLTNPKWTYCSDGCHLDISLILHSDENVVCVSMCQCVSMYWYDLEINSNAKLAKHNVKLAKFQHADTTVILRKGGIWEDIISRRFCYKRKRKPKDTLLLCEAYNTSR